MIHAPLRSLQRDPQDPGNGSDLKPHDPGNGSDLKPQDPGNGSYQCPSAEERMRNVWDTYMTNTQLHKKKENMPGRTWRSLCDLE